MNRRINYILDEILENEGGFVNHPNDKGGATNFGITQKTLSQFLGKAASVDDVRLMPVSLAKDIYLKYYLIPAQIEMFFPSIDLIFADMVVNHGLGNATRILQKSCVALGSDIKIDRKLGRKTIFAANNLLQEGKPIVKELCNQRAAFFKGIVNRFNNQKLFLKGWLVRANKYSNLQEDSFLV